MSHARVQRLEQGLILMLDDLLEDRAELSWRKLLYV